MELLMIVTIMGLIAVIVLAALTESRTKSRNSATLEQIRQYQKALDLVLSDDNAYPPSSAIAAVNPYACLGDYTTNTCWNNANVSEYEPLADKLAPYIKLPAGTHTIGTYRGYIYRQLNGGTHYELRWALEGGAGSAEMCGFPPSLVVGQNIIGNTICIYTHPY